MLQNTVDRCKSITDINGFFCITFENQYEIVNNKENFLKE